MAEFAYQMAQLALAFLFGIALPDDFEEELFDVNQHLRSYKPKVGEYGEAGFPTIEFEIASAFRRFTNVFEIRDAVRKTTTAQIAEAQTIGAP
jgi:hypothetical protein